MSSVIRAFINAVLAAVLCTQTKKNLMLSMPLLILLQVNQTVLMMINIHTILFQGLIAFSIKLKMIEKRNILNTWSKKNLANLGLLKMAANCTFVQLSA